MIATKARLAYSLAVGVMLSPSIWAANSISPFSLGTLDAVVSFCRQVNPPGSMAYLRLSATLTDGFNDHSLDQMRHSAEYSSAYSQFSAALSNDVPQSDARAACIQIASADTGHGQSSGHEGHDEHGDRDEHDAGRNRHD